MTIGELHKILGALIKDGHGDVMVGYENDHGGYLEAFGDKPRLLKLSEAEASEFESDLEKGDLFLVLGSISETNAVWDGEFSEV
jgi:hypothetical protein